MATKISIVTPSLNRREMIAASLTSASDQWDDDVEHIVVDGGSTDGTVELIRADFPRVRLIVQQDKNLYEAINRGIEQSSGEIIGLLNSDDRLLPNALAAVRAALASAPGADAVCGGCAMHSMEGSPNGTLMRVYNAATMKALRGGDIISGLPLTNGRFFRRRVFEILGGFDDGIPTLADRDFLARLHLAGIRTAVIDAVVYSYGCHSGSLTFNGEISLKHLAEATALARRRMIEVTAAPHRMFYRRWHGWASGYECLQALLRRQGRNFLALFARATRSDPLWPLFFLNQLAWHLRTRVERTGAAPLRHPLHEAHP